MTNAKLLPLALLYVDGRRAVEGSTRFQKLVFLSQQENDFDDEFDFEAYDYGPFSKELAAVLDELDRRDFIKKSEDTTRSGNDKHVYKLTNKGHSAVRSSLDFEADRELFEIAESVKKSYNERPLRELLQYVYNQYPQYAENSKLDL